MRKNEIEEIYDLLSGRMGIQNIKISLNKSDSDKIINVYDAIHEFWTLWTYILDSDEQILSRNAFLIYHKESSDMLVQSFVQALSWHYNTANILLRAVFELYIRGTFYDCLAREEYRCELNLNTNSGKNTIRKIIEDAIKENPGKYDDLEIFSPKILFIINPLIYEYEKDNRYHLPNFRDILQILVQWGLFSPMDRDKSINETVNEIYDIYKFLSENVHAKHYSIDIMRRASIDSNILEPKFLKMDLDLYLDNLLAVIDFGTLTTFNILKDLIGDNLDIKNRLRSRLEALDNLNLRYTYLAVQEFVE